MNSVLIFSLFFPKVKPITLKVGELPEKKHTGHLARGGWGKFYNGDPELENGSFSVCYVKAVSPVAKVKCATAQPHWRTL